MEQEIEIGRCRIPLTLLPLYRQIEDEFEMSVRDAIKTKRTKKTAKKKEKREMGIAMLAMLKRF